MNLMSQVLHTVPRCPFCGDFPEEVGETYVVCRHEGCAIQGQIIEIEMWCKRPLEKEYEIDLMHAREAYDAQVRTLDQFRLDWPVLRDMIDTTLLPISRKSVSTQMNSGLKEAEV